MPPKKQSHACDALLEYALHVAVLKITFKNLPIIKIKAAEKKVAHHGWATRKFFQNKNFESVWTCLQKVSVLSHAFHDLFKRSSNEGDFP